MLKFFATLIIFLTFLVTVIANEGGQASNFMLNSATMSDHSISQISARTIFKIGLPNESSSMETKISYFNAEAEEMRNFYQQIGANGMQNYVDDYFAAYHGKLENIGLLEIEDDVEKNILSIKASYLLQEFWQENPDEQKYYFTIFPKHILEAIDFNVNPLSQYPFALNPVQISEHITFITSNEDWPAVHFQKNFDSDEVSLSYANQSEGKELHFIYLYMTKEDHVPIGRLGEHRKFLTEIEDYLITAMGMPIASLQDILGLRNENYLLLGLLTVCYSWLIVMLTKRKGKRDEMVR